MENTPTLESTGSLTKPIFRYRSLDRAMEMRKPLPLVNEPLKKSNRDFAGFLIGDWMSVVAEMTAASLHPPEGE